MNETFILLKVTHKKPIPEIATDIVAQRAYMWFYSQGVEVGVTATLVETPEKLKCGSECDHLCQQPDGFGGCGRRS